MTKKLPILIIDDGGKKCLGALVLGRVFDRKLIKTYKDVTPALAALTRAKNAGAELPQAVILDAYDQMDTRWGAKNAVRIIEWFQKNAPDQMPKHIIINSADEEWAMESANDVTRRTGVRVLSGDKESLSAIRRFQSGEDGYKLGDTNGFEIFFNDTLELGLPTTQEEFITYLQSKENMAPDDVVRLYENDVIGRQDALLKMAPHMAEGVARRYHRALVTENEHNNVQLAKRSVFFGEAQGLPAGGYAAFSVDDVKQLAAEGKKSILVLQKYAFDFIPHLKNIAGVVIMEEEGSAHLGMVLRAHNIPCLIGLLGGNEQEKLEFNPAAKEMTLRVKMNPMDNSSEMSLYMKLRDNWYKANDLDPYDSDREPPDFRTIESVVKTGDPITCATDWGRLYFVAAKIDKPFGRNYSERWLEKVDMWLGGWQRQHDVQGLQWKMTVDTQSQLYDGDGSTAIGLLRTEHFIIADEDMMALFRKSVLTRDVDVLADFEFMQQDMFADIVHKGASHGLRVRLVDAPPAEFFPEGGVTLRGVQLAQEVPEIYEAQIRACMRTYKEGLAQYLEDLDFEREYAPLEIMVPTVESEHDVLFVKEMVERIAAEVGLPREQYRFGTMLETIGACKDAQNIARHVDFMSIGSNDLTSQVLKCERDNWERRHKLTMENGERDPFLVLHDDVYAVLAKAIMDARKTNPDLQIDLCGEHGANLETLEMLRPLNLNAVSVVPTDRNLKGLKTLYRHNSFLLAQGGNAPKPLSGFNFR